MKNLTLFILTSMMWATPSFAGLLFNYSQLALKDLDQMNELARKKMEESKTSGAPEPVREALQAVYARPDNGDGMVEKVAPMIRNDLDENDQWESSMDILVEEAIGALKNPKAFKPVVQNTYAVFLNNVIADFKPFAEKDGHERRTIKHIRDAKIEMSKEAKNETSLRGMKVLKSPSEVAAGVMEKIEKDEAANKKAEAEAKKKEKKKK